ncbi:hypothetical protein WT24_23430 [Burkholderia sp. MSMB1078WGS]|nr:hypothetical protein WT24_23430 [Burkholderia sp. MSMB1078WGS]
MRPARCGAASGPACKRTVHDRRETKCAAAADDDPATGRRRHDRASLPPDAQADAGNPGGRPLPSDE